MKGFKNKSIAVLALCALLIQCVCLPMVALAQEGQDGGDQVYISNLIAIEDIAILAKEVEDLEEEVPEGAIRISVEWLPDDEAAPESVTVIIVGSGTIEKVVLGPETGWRKTIEQPQSTLPLTYTLLGVTEDFEIDETSSSVAFTVQLPEAEGDDLEGDDLEGVIPDVISGGVDNGADYAVSISANVSHAQVLNYGDSITLYAVLSGYEGVDYSLVWYCDRGNGFMPIEGVSGWSYSFVLTEENAFWVYQVEVVVTQ